MIESLAALALVALGGAVGAVLRYLLSVGMLRYFAIQQWVGIMLINVVGCLLIGACAAGLVMVSGTPGPVADWLSTASGIPAEMAAHRGHLLLMTGVLGGFTTFSTAMLDVFVLWRQGKKVSAAITLVVTPVAAILAVMVGFGIGGAL